MLTNLTPLKVMAALAFALGLFHFFGLGEYPEQINNAADMIAGLAIVDISSWPLPMITLFEYAMYGLMLLILAAYLLIFFGFKIGRWALLIPILAALPLPLVTGGIVSTMAETTLDMLISMLNGCLVYLLFFSKNEND